METFISSEYINIIKYGLSKFHSQHIGRRPVRELYYCCSLEQLAQLALLELGKGVGSHVA